MESSENNNSKNKLKSASEVFKQRKQAVSVQMSKMGSASNITVNIRLILALFGMFFVCSSFMINIFTFVTSKQIHSGLYLCLYLGGLTVAYFVIGCFSDYIQNHKVAFNTIAMALVLFSFVGHFISFLVDIQYVVQAVSALLSGCAISLLISQWINALLFWIQKGTRIYLLTLFFLASCMTLVSMFVEENPRYIMQTIFILLSLLFLFLIFVCNKKESFYYDIEHKKSKERFSIPKNAIILSITNAFVQGYLLSFFRYSNEQNNEFQSWTLSLAVLIIIAILLLDAFQSSNINESVFRHFMLPLIAAALLFMLILPQKTRLTICVFAFAFSLIPYASSLTATCVHIIQSHLSCLHVLGSCRSGTIFSFLVGFVGGYICCVSIFFAQEGFLVGTILVLLVLITVTIVFDNKSFYPNSNGTDTVYQDKDVPSPKQGRWLQKCESLSKQANLTSREKEIMILLSKGYTLKNIEEKLCISNNTVKTHSYNIYNKLDIHSKSELIKLLDEVELKNSL